MTLQSVVLTVQDFLGRINDEMKNKSDAYIVPVYTGDVGSSEPQTELDVDADQSLAHRAPHGQTAVSLSRVLRGRETVTINIDMFQLVLIGRNAELSMVFTVTGSLMWWRVKM